MTGPDSRLPTVVADVGNTRIKWGRCGPSAIEQAVALPDDPDAWRLQLATWHIESPTSWVVSGVHPARRDRLMAWLRDRGHAVRMIDSYRQIPLTVKLDSPERVGLDRLFDVLAARQLVAPRQPAVVVDAGSAVTVNLLDEDGAFAGGAIFPGLRLMAEALHDYTAQLPLVRVTDHPAILPAKSTIPAIAAGIRFAVAGGIVALVRELHATVPTTDVLPVILTGGDAAEVEPYLSDRDLYQYQVRPWLTLEGIRLAAIHG